MKATTKNKMIIKVIGYILAGIGGGIVGYHAGFWGLLGIVFIVFGNSLVWSTNHNRYE